MQILLKQDAQLLLICFPKVIQQIAVYDVFLIIDRSSCPEVFCKKGFLESFTKFTGKHLCQSLFFNKDADLRPATLLKKRFQHSSFPVNFC